jgi:pimeloyl-ACP methyl ester carboxylesterase
VANQRNTFGVVTGGKQGRIREVLMSLTVHQSDIALDQSATADRGPIQSSSRAARPIAMKRKLLIGVSVLLALVVAAVTATKLTIRHDRLPLYDAARSRSVPVDLYVRRDKLMAAYAGMGPLPVALVNHGNTVGSNEYSFICNMLAARGFLVASIQHDLPTDPPISMTGYPYVGRLPAYERGAANIDFVLGELKKSEPIGDYDHLLLVGHSNGGDISVFYAAAHPDTVAKVVTLDNLRVPLEFVRSRLLSFRSVGGAYKPDQGVVPGEADREKEGIDVVMTGAPHTDLSDRGPDALKERISSALSEFLDREKPAPKRPPVTTQYAPGAPY